MQSDPRAAWTRLGQRLMRRRIELDPRYRNRRVFTAERAVEYRIVNDIELGRRENYEPATIAAIEVAYQLARGSIEAFLSGADLEVEARPDWRPQPGPDAFFSPEESAAAEPYVAELRARYEFLRALGVTSPAGSDMFENWRTDPAEAGLAATWDAVASRTVARDEARHLAQVLWGTALYRVRREARMHGQGNADSALPPVTAATALPPTTDTGR
jgi:hypothetical protein